MNPKRIRLLIWKEFLQLRRDPLLLRLLFVMPVMQLMMFGYVVGADVKNLSTAVVDLDRTVDVAAARAAFESSGYFDVTAAPRDERALRPLLDRGDVKVAVVIPEGTESQDSARRRRHPSGSSWTARTARPRRRRAATPPRSSRRSTPSASPSRASSSPGPGIDARVRVLFNPSLRAVNSMIPGLIAIILMLSMISIMSQAVVRERERGTLEQMFVTPISRGEYLVGKLTPYVMIAIVQMALVTLVGRLWFRVPFNGQVSGRGARAVAVHVHRHRAGAVHLARLADPAAGTADASCSSCCRRWCCPASSSRSSRCRRSFRLTYLIPLRYAHRGPARRTS